MKRIIAIIAITILGTGCASTGTAPSYNYQTGANQVVKEVDGHQSVYSIDDRSFVTLSPRYEDLNKHQGKMFVVGAFNRSGRSIVFGPSNVEVTDLNGNPLKLLDRNSVKAIEEKRQRGKKVMSGILATAATFAVAYAAGDYIAEQQMAGFDTTLLQYNLNNAVASIGTSAFNASSLYNKSLDKAVSAQIKHFENKALAMDALSDNESGGGFFVVEGNPSSMIVRITAGRDTHQFVLHQQ